MNGKYKWKNLKDKLCPVCKSDLQYYDNNEVYKCLDCDFIITENRFEDLLKEFDREELEAL